MYIPSVISEVTNIVPLAALYSGSNYYYNKNFAAPTAAGTTTWNTKLVNLNIADYNKMSFQLGGDLGSPIIGGVYGYTNSTNVNIDYTSVAGELRPYRMGIVAFGPRSYFTGAESSLPHIVAICANTKNNETSAANVQVGGHCTTNNHFAFDTPLSSNLYGVYGFDSNVDSGGLYGGAIVRSYHMAVDGFDFNTYAANSNSNFPSSNFQFVVVQ